MKQKLQASHFSLGRPVRVIAVAPALMVIDQCGQRGSETGPACILCALRNWGSVRGKQNVPGVGGTWAEKVAFTSLVQILKSAPKRAEEGHYFF